MESEEPTWDVGELDLESCCNGDLVRYSRCVTKISTVDVLPKKGERINERGKSGFCIMIFVLKFMTEECQPLSNF